MEAKVHDTATVQTIREDLGRGGCTQGKTETVYLRTLSKTTNREEW